MVKGLEHFRRHFFAYKDQYILIGGTACTLLMQDSGLNFRATKDLDIVLYVEALNSNFVRAFWEFIEEGGYQNRQRSKEKAIFYRFDSPSRDDYPAMLELFSRMPDGVKLSGKSHLTPIPMDEAVTSLSAILLDEDYYHFIHSGKREIDDLSILDVTHLIPLKARAHIDLVNRKNNDDDIDEKDIRKHRNDVIRLYQLLSPNNRTKLPLSIEKDMQFFLSNLKKDKSIDCKSLGLKHANINTIVEMLEEIYAIRLNSFKETASLAV